MGSVKLQPGDQELLKVFPPTFSKWILMELWKTRDGRKKIRANASSVKRKAGQKSLLSGKDFVIPELVGHAENGDISVSLIPLGCP